jgi:hypothetical protein
MASDDPYSILGRFSYRKAFTSSTTYYAAVIMVGPALGIGMMIRGEFLAGIVIALIWCLFFIPFALNAILIKSDVVVTQTGLLWQTHGLTWKSIPWAKIAKIRVFDVYDYASRRKLKTYYVDQSVNPISYFRHNGWLSFNEEIEGFNELLGLLKKHTNLLS